jgi:hypothetical protein
MDQGTRETMGINKQKRQWINERIGNNGDQGSEKTMEIKETNKKQWGINERIGNNKDQRTKETIGGSGTMEGSK